MKKLIYLSILIIFSACNSDKKEVFEKYKESVSKMENDIKSNLKSRESYKLLQVSITETWIDDEDNIDGLCPVISEGVFCIENLDSERIKKYNRDKEKFISSGKHMKGFDVLIEYSATNSYGARVDGSKIAHFDNAGK